MTDHMRPPSSVGVSDGGRAMTEPLGNDKGPLYAAARRIEAILDEAVLSGALTPVERRAFVLVERA